MSAEDAELAEVMLYGEIVQDYGKWYKETFPNDKCASDFDKEIKAVKDKGAKRLMLRINSPGGIVFEAVAIRSILVNAGFEEITIRIEGLCASAATIPATIPKAHVQISEGSEFMIHNPWTIAWGFAKDLEHEAEHLRNMEKTIRGFYATKSGQEDEQLKAWMDAETWMSAEEAVEYGFCDELLKAEEENAEPMAACVTSDVMAIMMGMYKGVPKDITIAKQQAGKTEMSLENFVNAAKAVFSKGTEGSNENPVAGFSTSNKNKEEPNTMEIKDVTQEMLLAENPALVEEIKNQAVAEERDRIAAIDDMTMPGFEAEAEEAKANGSTAQDFMKACRAKSAAMKAEEKQKGADFITARAKETAPAANVAPGAAEDAKTSEEDELKAWAKESAVIAANMSGNGIGMF
jgi:ATP-dependent Clp protease protease subunit